MTDPDGIYPGQTWTARYLSGNSVRVTVIDGNRIGFTPKTSGSVKYLTRRKFLTAYQRTQPAA